MAGLRRRWTGLAGATPTKPVLAALALVLVLAAVVRLPGGPVRSGHPEPAVISVRPADEGHEGPLGAASAPGRLLASPPGILRFGGANAARPADAPASPARILSPDDASSPAPPAAPLLQYPREWHEFYFTRAVYSSYGRGWGGRSRSWAIDYPKSDRQFLTVLKRLTNLDAYDDENAIPLNDPQIRRFPFLYALEVGYMSMSQPEVEGLRDYLLAGGFLVIDDFWGSQEWAQFEFQMKLVFPERPIIDLDLDHTVFNTFYEIDEILQVPAYGRYWGGQTWERDGYVPFVKGIEDDNGRLMVIINWNTDLGDAWEWAEQPDYPVPYSTFAFQMGVNMIVYAMTH
ncbi:MAG: DUF4159 domain-containing protein [Gemmatimonadetes bacterium]|nr:DUF4159 domain-containing protein [Gemmatimonadota bacterium]MYE68500.1 DUF4159 domain-containing protein [Gemmatimonadota bacterium]MYJ68497.1 DUF4159 domain-containing protein [Gemmatimonadota bacterium]